MRRTSAFRPFIFCCLCLVAIATPTARGQGSAADRARLQQTQGIFRTPSSASAEGVDQGYAAASPNDTDLGEQAILKRVEKYEPFTLETGTPIYYTSNVAPVVALTYAPKFQRTLYGEFTVRQQFFYYQDFSAFNFASFDAIAGLVYYVPKLNNLALRANIDYNRLTGTTNFDDFFSNYALNLSAEMPFRIGRAQQISVGANASISLYASPDPPRRNDLGFFVGYTANLSRSFSINAATSVVVRPYDSGGRTDVSEIVSLSASYRIKEWLTLSAISSFVANQSNRSVFDYEVFNVGGGISLTWKF
jgi:hypothetical protein